MNKLRFFILFFAPFILAQVNIGAKNDPFISTNAITENPSVFLQNPNSWEMNLLSVDIFGSNNYAFISKKNLLALSTDNKLVINRTSGQNNLPKNTIGFQDKKKFNFHYQADILGPAIALKFKLKEHEFAAGFYTRLRAFGNSFNIDNQYRYVSYIDQDNFNRYFQPLHGSHATLEEYNFFLSKSFSIDKSKEFLAGFTIKQSKVLDALFIKEKNVYRVDYDLVSNAFTLNDYNADVFVATSYDFEKKTYKPKNNGSSLGTDVGFSYVDYGEHEKEDGQYLQKINFSVTDIGFIKVNGELHHYQGDPFFITPNVSFKNTDNIYNFLKELSTKVYGNGNASLQGNSLSIALPTALHLSYSGNLLKSRYATFGITQRLPLSKNTFKSPNVVYINFSKSKNAISYAAQFSMFEYKSPQFGGYFRIGAFFLGSDNILPVFFRQKKLDSFDFYVGVKLFPFWDNAFKKHRRKDCNCSN